MLFLNLFFSYARSVHVDSPPYIPSLTTSYVHGTSSISLLPLTVGQCLDTTAQRWPDREAVVFLQDGIRKTFVQFQQDVSLRSRAFIFCFKMPELILLVVKNFCNISVTLIGAGWQDGCRSACFGYEAGWPTWGLGAEHIWVDPFPVCFSQGWNYTGMFGSCLYLSDYSCNIVVRLTVLQLDDWMNTVPVLC